MIEDAVKELIQQSVITAFATELNNVTEAISEALKKIDDKQVESLQLHTVSDVAKILKVSKNTVYEYIKNGEIEAVEVNGYKFTDKQIKDFVDSRTLN